MTRLSIRTGNNILMKETNKSILLNVIRNKTPLSRADLSKLTGLNKVTVSSIVEELINECLVIEMGVKESILGRKPMQLKLNERAGSILGIEIGVEYIHALLTHLDSSIIYEDTIKISPSDSAQKNIEILTQLIKKILKKAPDTPKGVIGIGVGVPGIVDSRSGTILMAPNLSWTNIQIKDILQEQFPNILIKIDNEANMGALGEMYFGSGIDVDSYIYLSVGTGIGTGIVINRVISRGSKGIAGEFGHMTIQENGLPCKCGSYGCWTLYASGNALKRYYNELTASSNHPSVEMEDIIEKAKAGDINSIEALNKVGYYLGVGTSNILHGLNPNLIILGNTMLNAGGWIVNPMLKTLQDRSIKHFIEGTQIVLSTLGPYACSIGAVASILEEILMVPMAGFN